MTSPTRLPAEPKPEWVRVAVDTREQRPLSLAPLQTVSIGLQTGDYQLADADGLAVAERKSLPDFLTCVGKERERFEREIERLLAFPHRLLLIETDWATVQAGNFERSKITAAQATASILGWASRGLPVLLVGSHEAAGKAVSKFLYLAARRRWREARGLVDSYLLEAAE